MTVKFKIGETSLGDDQPTYFIADIAANHDGKLDRALKLIELAAEAGAQAVKFQHFRAEKIVSLRGFERLGKLDHQSKWTRSVVDTYRDASISWDWTEAMAEHAQHCGVAFMSTPYDLEAADHIDPYVPAFKIGSGDIDWLNLIEHVANKKKPVIIATGASTFEEVCTASEILQESGVPFSIMQCNTNYTANPGNFRFLNLRVLETYKSKFPEALPGLSDHTLGHVAVLGSIALGARVVEKHFTDDNERPGPDHAFSLTPRTWSAMISDSRQLEAALGDGVKVVEENELLTASIQRRGLRYSRRMEKGERITTSDIIALRPFEQGGVRPTMLALITGKVLAFGVEPDQAVAPDHFSD